MSKIVIGIHGLGNKPSKDLLTKWWMQSICEGLIKTSRFQFAPKFELVYWADILNDKPLNRLIADPENPYALDEPYTPSPEKIEPEQHSTRKKFLGFLEDQMDKIFLNEDLTSNFTFVSEVVFKKYFKELEIYYAKQPEVNDTTFKSVKDIIRKRLVDILKKHKGKEILLISHSMGTIIAYDVCNFLVHDIKVDTFVTMGSPLGIPIIVSKIAEEQKSFQPNITKLKTPENIQRNWFNYSDIEDNVALNYNLGDDFEANLNGVKVQDTIIENNYMVNGELNPHKSYGYLRTPEFSTMLSDFLEREVSGAKLWWLRKSYETQKLLAEIKNNLNPFAKGEQGE